MQDACQIQLKSTDANRIGLKRARQEQYYVSSSLTNRASLVSWSSNLSEREPILHSNVPLI
jgi:hypothetical protein